jgi:hypothetical protein
MKTSNLYNGKDFPANLMPLLDAYCDHVFIKGSTNLASAYNWEDQKNILVEIEAAAKLQIQVHRFLRGETKEVQLHMSFICPIISFMGQAKMYDPEVVLYLIGLTHG